MVSVGLLAPPLFFIAAKKRVVSTVVPVVYAVLVHGSSALGPTLGNPKKWMGGVLAITMIVAAVHAAILDAGWKLDDDWRERACRAESSVPGDRQHDARDTRGPQP
ncbi:hypothetical protein [Streptomyces sp. NBC_00859]|uniref:hypothetical protein n=1 Tax=Streptomyces sp. NBC_00859 TaxID=2903682 RepID=UPI00386433BF|nr:hypothetical protein OG584_25205 [Streptomyces sp. NBC_00859]